MVSSLQRPTMARPSAKIVNSTGSPPRPGTLRSWPCKDPPRIVNCPWSSNCFCSAGKSMSTVGLATLVRCMGRTCIAPRPHKCATRDASFTGSRNENSFLPQHAQCSSTETAIVACRCAAKSTLHNFRSSKSARPASKNNAWLEANAPTIPTTGPITPARSHVGNTPGVGISGNTQRKHAPRAAKWVTFDSPVLTTSLEMRA